MGIGNPPNVSPRNARKVNASMDVFSANVEVALRKAASPEDLRVIKNLFDDFRHDLMPFLISDEYGKMRELLKPGAVALGSLEDYRERQAPAEPLDELFVDDLIREISVTMLAQLSGVCDCLLDEGNLAVAKMRGVQGREQRVLENLSLLAENVAALFERQLDEVQAAFDADRRRYQGQLYIGQ